MDNLARKLDDDSFMQEAGTVVTRKAGALEVRTPSGTYQARRAVSCLVAPEEGDQVLVALTQAGRCYVLAVLERDSADVEVATEGDLTIRLPKGRFQLLTQLGAKLVSAKDLTFTSSRFNLHALDGNLVLGRLTYVGRYVRSEIERIKSLAGTMDTVLERLSLRAKRSYRTVEGLDQLRAGQIQHRAEKNCSLHGENAVVTADELVKVDGEQIHLG
jgi:hypothetical protein